MECINIAVSLTKNDFNRQIKLLRKYTSKIKFLEIRADTFYPEKENITKILTKISPLIKQKKISTILTFRSFSEGGKIKLSPQKITNFVSQILHENQKHINFIDIEINLRNKKQLINTTKKYNKKIIYSVHYLNNNEDTNIDKIRKLKIKNKGYHILKIVAKIDSFNKYFETLKNLKHKNYHNTTFFTVGKTSLLSRLISVILKMPLVFVSLAKPVIKSQPDIKTFLSSIHKIGY